MLAQEELTQVERDKLEIDPDIDFRAVAARPFSDLTPNELGMFKWSGVYHQLQRGFFMVRVSVPGGTMTAEQLRRIGELATRCAQDRLCITTRQTLQFHWISQQDIYKIIEGVAEVGLTTRNACGDVCRNVVSCSLQGVCPHEVGDTRPVLESIARDPVIQDQKRNLPRKHKIAVSGCAAGCGHGIMNCQGFYPVTRATANGEQERGWAFTAGGGLGSLPYMAKAIFDWVPEALVLHVSRAVVEIHNRLGNRRKRRFARTKIIVDDMGARAFGEHVLDVMSEAGVEGLERISSSASDAPALRPFPYDGERVIPQKQAGLNTVRIRVPRSEFSGAEARQFAEWADTFGSGRVAFTPRQNVELRDIPDTGIKALSDAMRAAGCLTDGFDHLPDIVACVGTTMCNLAVSDTPRAYRLLTEAFADDAALWREVGPLRINMNGCPNSCAQHWIADIGLRGKRRRRDRGSEEGFSVYAGGRLDASGHIAEFLRDVATSDLVRFVRAMLDAYLANREAGETFGAFARRVGGKTFDGLASEHFADSADEPDATRNMRLRATMQRVFEEAGEQR
jgi:sulfite reductase beta subunit-like hemoprotein